MEYNYDFFPAQRLKAIRDHIGRMAQDGWQVHTIQILPPASPGENGSQWKSEPIMYILLQRETA